MDKVLILNVDDDEVGRYAKSRTLRLAGYETIEAATGLEALQLVESRMPDLVLLDVKLPDVNGFEVCRRIKSNPATQMVSVLQVSASFVAAEDRVHGLEGGADGYLTTPIETPVLLATIRALLRARRAEAELIRNQRILDDFFENAAMGLQWLSEEGTILRANRTQLEMVGRSRADYEGHPFAEFLENPSTAAGLLNRLRRGEVLHSCEIRLRAANGTTRDALLNANVLWEHGRFVHARCFMRDVSDLKQINADLQESQGRLELALRAADMGTFSIDLRTQMAEMSDRVAKVFGLPNHGSLFSLDTLLDHVHPDDRDFLRQQLSHLTVSDSLEAEYRVIAPDGQFRWVAQLGRVVCDDHNRPCRVVGVVMEITQRKEAETRLRDHAEQLQRATTRLEEANRAKDEFLATVSHELRTPLTAIIGWSKLLLRNQVADSRHATQVIERSAQSLGKLVEDLLDMNRIVSGKVVLRREMHDIEALVRNVLESVAPAAAAKHIRLESQIAAGPILAWCDSNRIQQVVWNLLTNAVKFTPSDGAIVTSVTRNADRVEISVRDTGQGIGAEFLPYVFERFRQANASTTRQHGGLGLGLAIAKKLVELHGGQIRAESDGEGQGANFVVNLPLPITTSSVKEQTAPDHGFEETAGENDADLTPGVLAGATILVVEDDPDTCHLASGVLESVGARTVCARSAQEGIEALIASPCDLVVSDISMPGEDGYAFVRRIRASDQSVANLPCIALTALARPEDRERAMAAGFDDHVPKPFDPQVLVRRVAAALRGPRTISPAHVLLADDNLDIAELLKDSLEARGYRVSVVGSVAEAIRVAQRIPVDVLISDLRLEDGNGWEILEALQKDRKTPGIVISGFSDDHYIERSKAAGFSRYLVKPVDEQDLLGVLAEVLAAGKVDARDEL